MKSRVPPFTKTPRVTWRLGLVGANVREVRVAVGLFFRFASHSRWQRVCPGQHACRSRRPSNGVSRHLDEQCKRREADNETRTARPLAIGATSGERRRSTTRTASRPGRRRRPRTRLHRSARSQGRRPSMRGVPSGVGSRCWLDMGADRRRSGGQPSGGSTKARDQDRPPPGRQPNSRRRH